MRRRSGDPGVVVVGGELRVELGYVTAHGRGRLQRDESASENASRALTESAPSAAAETRSV